MPSPIIAIPRRMNYGRPSIIRIGPWAKGMVSRYVDFSGDQAASLIDNCDVLPDGELKQRQPIQTISGITNCFASNATIQAAMTAQPNVTNWRCELVYQVKTPTDAAGNPSTIGVFRASHTGNGPYLYAFLNLSTGVLLASGVLQLSNMVLYNGKVYAIAGTFAGANGGKVFWWSASDPGGSSGATASIAWGTTEPPNAITIFKDRVYAFNADSNLSDDAGSAFDKVWFSVSGDPLTWTGNPDAGFFSLSTNSEQLGARQRVRAVVGLRSTLYIFTTTTTWALSMPSSGIPTNGTLQVINNRIGVANERCVVTSDSKLFIVATTGVYELLNSSFIDIGYTLGEQLLPNLGNYDSLGISIAGDRVYVFANPPQASSPDLSQVVNSFAYVFNLKSRAWSTISIGDTTLSGAPIFNVLKIVPYVLNNTGPILPVQNGFDTYSQGAIFVDPKTGKVYHMAPDTSHTSNQGWCDFYGGASKTIIMTVWTQDLTGATTEQSSWKRYYSVTVNIYKRFSGNAASTLNLVAADHNSNPIVNASVSLPISSIGSTFFSIKQFTSLRARHIQYFIQIDTGKVGPHSLLSLDVLAKLKQTEQSGQVGN